MPRVALQAHDLAAFRERAAVAATKLFARDGYVAVTMRALAEELGVSAMTPYRYLAGKEELFALVREHAFRRFAEHLEGIAPGGSAIERLHRLKARYLRFAIDHSDEYRIMFELRQPDDAERWPALGREASRAFACLLAMVTIAVDAGALRGDPLTIAHLLWASTHGLVSLHLAGRLSSHVLEQLAVIDHELLPFQPVPSRRRASRRTGSARSSRPRSPRIKRTS
jgi:AcrR family transcriptional regulator